MWWHAGGSGNDQGMVLGLVILLAMTAACMASGLFGVLVPLTLQRFGADPCTASSIDERRLSPHYCPVRKPTRRTIAQSIVGTWLAECGGRLSQRSHRPQWNTKTAEGCYWVGLLGETKRLALVG
jgi:hypothetical protein